MAIFVGPIQFNAKPISATLHSRDGDKRKKMNYINTSMIVSIHNTMLKKEVDIHVIFQSDFIQSGICINSSKLKFCWAMK